MIEFIRTQEELQTLSDIIRDKDGSLLDSILRFKTFTELREEVIDVVTVLTNFIEQQKKNEEEAQQYRVVLEESLAKLTGVCSEHSRQMAIAFKNAGRLNLDVHAKEFIENKRREKSDLVTRSPRNQTNFNAFHLYPRGQSRTAEIRPTRVEEEPLRPPPYHANALIRYYKPSMFRRLIALNSNQTLRLHAA